jgi:hypothetical protein
MKLIAVILLPLIAALHRYACNMGYRYMSRRLAFDDALRVGLMTAIVLGFGLVLSSCIGERTKLEGTHEIDVAPMSRDAERQHIIEQGQDFCARYKDDPACHSKSR